MANALPIVVIVVCIISSVNCRPADAESVAEAEHNGEARQVVISDILSDVSNLYNRQMNNIRQYQDCKASYDLQLTGFMNCFKLLYGGLSTDQQQQYYQNPQGVGGPSNYPDFVNHEQQWYQQQQQQGDPYKGQQSYPHGQDYPQGQGYPFSPDQGYPQGQGFPHGEKYPLGQDYSQGQGYPQGQSGYPESPDLSYPQGQGSGYPQGQGQVPGYPGQRYPQGQDRPQGQSGYPESPDPSYPSAQGSGYPEGQGQMQGYPGQRYPGSGGVQAGYTPLDQEEGYPYQGSGGYPMQMQGSASNLNGMSSQGPYGQRPMKRYGIFDAQDEPMGVGIRSTFLNPPGLMTGPYPPQMSTAGQQPEVAGYMLYW